MNSLIAQLDLYFGQKAPALPVGIKEFLVKAAPYLAIIGVIFSGLGLLALLPFLTGGGALGMMGYYPAMYGSSLWLGVIFGLAIVILEIMAVPGLFKRNLTGWTYLFYAQLVALVQMLVTMNLVGLIIGGLIGFYLLFQVRSYYIGGMSMSSNNMPPTSPEPMV
ncbi:MAG: hypothetical protein Q7T49_00695 [bacterium]|nr:hypothetical protein [bacterium]